MSTISEDVKATLASLQTLLTAKSKDYGESNAFTEPRFKWGRSNYDGFDLIMVRINDKLARIENLLSNGSVSVKDETVKDTFLDLAGYCVLATVALGRKKEKKVERN